MPAVGVVKRKSASSEGYNFPRYWPISLVDDVLS